MPSKLTQNITIKELQAQIEALKADSTKSAATIALRILSSNASKRPCILRTACSKGRWFGSETISAAWPIVTLMFCKRSLPRALWQ